MPTSTAIRYRSSRPRVPTTGPASGATTNRPTPRTGYSIGVIAASGLGAAEAGTDGDGAATGAGAGKPPPTGPQPSTPPDLTTIIEPSSHRAHRFTRSHLSARHASTLMTG